MMQITELVIEPRNTMHIKDGDFLSFTSSLIDMVRSIKVLIEPYLMNLSFLRNQYIKSIKLVEIILNDQYDMQVKERELRQL